MEALFNNIIIHIAHCLSPPDKVAFRRVCKWLNQCLLSDLICGWEFSEKWVTEFAEAGDEFFYNWGDWKFSKETSLYLPFSAAKSVTLLEYYSPSSSEERNFKHASIVDNFINTAARYGSIPSLVWMKERWPSFVLKYSPRRAAENGHLGTLQWMEKECGLSRETCIKQGGWSQPPVVDAMKNGHFHIEDWVKEKVDISKDLLILATKEAVHASNASTVLNLISREEHIDAVALISVLTEVLYCSQVSLADQIHKKRPIDKDLFLDHLTPLMRGLSDSDKLESLKWLHKTFNITRAEITVPYHDAMVRMITEKEIMTEPWSNDPDVLAWLRETYGLKWPLE